MADEEEERGTRENGLDIDISNFCICYALLPLSFTFEFFICMSFALRIELPQLRQPNTIDNHPPHCYWF